MTDLTPDDNELITAVAGGDQPALLGGGTSARGLWSSGVHAWNLT
jgi:hypothetical protein